MTIKHINPATRFACPGVFLFTGLTFYGKLYRCALCGKEFEINHNGEVVM